MSSPPSEPSDDRHGSPPGNDYSPNPNQANQSDHDERSSNHSDQPHLVSMYHQHGDHGAHVETSLREVFSLMLLTDNNDRALVTHLGRGLSDRPRWQPSRRSNFSLLPESYQNPLFQDTSFEDPPPPPYSPVDPIRREPSQDTSPQVGSRHPQGVSLQGTLHPNPTLGPMSPSQHVAANEVAARQARLRSRTPPLTATQTSTMPGMFPGTEDYYPAADSVMRASASVDQRFSPSLSGAGVTSIPVVTRRIFDEMTREERYRTILSFLSPHEKLVSPNHRQRMASEAAVAQDDPKLFQRLYITAHPHPSPTCSAPVATREMFDEMSPYDRYSTLLDRLVPFRAILNREDCDRVDHDASAAMEDPDEFCNLYNTAQPRSPAFRSVPVASREMFDEMPPSDRYSTLVHLLSPPGGLGDEDHVHQIAELATRAQGVPEQFIGLYNTTQSHFAELAQRQRDRWHSLRAHQR